MQIDFKKSFMKPLDKAPKKIQKTFFKKLEIFQKDAYNPILNNHNLTGKYKGLKSINITGDWRAIFEEYNKEELVIFILFGTHSQLYK